MDFLVLVMQTIFFLMFISTLACELSSKYKDTLVAVTIRMIVMISSFVASFTVDEIIYHENFILFLFTMSLLLLYTLYSKMLPKMKIDRRKTI